MASLVELYRFIPVKEFISKYEEAQHNSRVWTEMVDKIKEFAETQKHLGDVVINDITGKMILSHCFGESIAKLFRNWCREFYPCEADTHPEKSQSIVISDRNKATYSMKITQEAA